MGGHSGFQPIRNSLSPIIPQPQVGSVQGPGQAPQSQPPAVSGGDEPAQDYNVRKEAAEALSRKLDTMLLQAAKLSTRTVDDASLKSAMDAAHRGKADRKDLADAAKEAQKTMKAVSEFSGRQIAAALVAGKDGFLDWKEDSPVAKAILAAIDAQAKLSIRLTDLANSLADSPDVADGDDFDALSDLALQCDRRQSEIFNLAMDLADAVRNKGDDPALAARLDPDSKARRLMGYGGRFTESPENFREGLRLIDMLRSWFPQQVAAVDARNKDSVTKLNLDIDVATAKSLPAMEKFLMESIALDPNAELDSQDPEELFGMEGNKAMRFVGRRYPSGNTNTIAAAPPEKRDLLFDVFDALDPLPRTQAERKARRSVAEPGPLIARIFKNYDAVAALRDAGNLDRAHLVPLLYGDLGVPPDADNRQIENAFQAKLMTFGLDIFAQVAMMANESGETLDECANAIRADRRLPNAPYVSNFICRFDEFDGSDSHGRTTMLGNVFFALSQSATGTNVKDGFTTHGIVSDEHMPVTFTLSKDGKTGAVTIRYSQPQGFPFRFHWETTVALDGTYATTQMVVDKTRYACYTFTHGESRKRQADRHTPRPRRDARTA